MRILKRFAFAIFAVLFLIWAAASYYYLPKHDTVHISATEVKREDAKNKAGEVVTRDVRFVMAEQTPTGEPRIYRNEDAVLYGKMDSGDVAAAAANFAKSTEKPVVLVGYYGIRSELFSIYPNVLSLKKVVKPDDANPFPWPTFVYFALCLLLLFGMWRAIIKIRRWKPFQKKEGTAETST